jgi:MFS transporter, PPP family, 3-phenylpropionic acid transporter
LTALSTFFFTYFAFIGAVNPYFALWLQHNGYNPAQIGLMLALPPAMRLIGPTSWGRLADATGKRVKWLRLMAHVSAVGLLIIALAPYAGPYRVWAALLGLAVLHAMLSGQVPLTESLLLQKLGLHLQNYGRVRLFGSLGFVVAVLVLGPALDWLGTQWLLAMGAAILAAHIANSWRLQDEPALPKAQRGQVSLWGLFKLPHVPLFLAASFLMVFGHMALYIYFSLFLESVGYSNTMIGVLWAVSTVGEIAYFWFQARLKHDPLTGYTRCYWAAVLRFGALAWLAMPLGSPLWLLLLLQLLHTLTFAVHHAASMVLVKRLFPASAGSTANALFNTVTYGLAGTLGALVCALIWRSFGTQGAQAVFTMSALVCAMGAILAWRLRLALAAADIAASQQSGL